MRMFPEKSKQQLGNMTNWPRPRNGNKGTLATPRSPGLAKIILKEKVKKKAEEVKRGNGKCKRWILPQLQQLKTGGKGLLQSSKVPQ